MKMPVELHRSSYNGDNAHSAAAAGPVVRSAFRFCVADSELPKQAVGVSIAQYGEILQGQLDVRGHGLRRFLLSLPCNVLYSKVTFTPDDSGEFWVWPAHKQKLLTAVKLAAERLGRASVGGTLTVESNIDEAKGCGSSTADCVAGIYAFANAVGRAASDEEVARIVVKAELASDNFMFDRPVVFAHREGVVVHDLGQKLPKAEVLGFDCDSDGAVHTLEMEPAVYSWKQIQCFEMLVAALQRAVRSGDVALLGRVATASAVINQEFLPKPMFNDICSIAASAGACGVAIAHSGTVMSMLFEGEDEALKAKISTVRHDLQSLGISRTIRFHT